MGCEILLKSCNVSMSRAPCAKWMIMLLPVGLFMALTHVCGSFTLGTVQHFFLLHPFLTSKTCHCMFKPNITNTFFMVKLESYHWHHRSFLFDGGSIFFGSLSQPNSWSESISPAKQLNNPHGLHILKRETFTSNKWIPQGSPMGQFGSISKLQVHFKCQLCVTCLVLPIWDFHSHVCIKYNILYNYYRIYHASSSLYTNHTSRNPFSSI